MLTADLGLGREDVPWQMVAPIISGITTRWDVRCRAMSEKRRMGMSEQTARLRIVIWLVGFVVIFGGVSWVVTEGIGRHVAPPTHSHPFTLTPGPTPTPLVC
jgi:hypothetical protein